MNWLRTIVREVVGLFVDDAMFAGGIVLWVGIAWFLWPYVHGYLPGGVLLFLGLAAILIASTFGVARRAGKR